MRSPFTFFRDLLNQPNIVVAWVLYLAAINMTSLFFWDSVVAKAIIATFLISLILIMALYMRFGFTGILGCGHALWIPLTLFIIFWLPDNDLYFSSYLIVLVISLSISIALDVRDLIRFMTEHRSIKNLGRQRR